jgi:hypothetical protein
MEEFVPVQEIQDRNFSGQPDTEFALDSVVTLPNSDTWKLRRLAPQDPRLLELMKNIEDLPKKKLFPLLLFSEDLSLAPPPPNEARCSSLYERVLSCLDIREHPGSKKYSDSLLGAEHLNEKSHKLSHTAVHIVSQLQMVAVDNDRAYEEFYQRFAYVERDFKILASRNGGAS